MDKALMDFVHLIRSSKTGIEYRSAILEAERFDIIRGKDFVRWIQANMDKVPHQISKGRFGSVLILFT